MMYDKLSVVFAVLAGIFALSAVVIVGSTRGQCKCADERREAVELRCWQEQWADTYAAQAAYLGGRAR